MKINGNKKLSRINICCLIRQKYQMYNKCYSTACSLLQWIRAWNEGTYSTIWADIEDIFRLLLMMVMCVWGDTLFGVFEHKSIFLYKINGNNLQYYTICAVHDISPPVFIYWYFILTVTLASPTTLPSVHNCAADISHYHCHHYCRTWNKLLCVTVCK